MANVNYRQGIISYTRDANNKPAFLQSNALGYVSILAQASRVVFTAAHGTSNYTFEEWQNVSNAWGPFPTSSTYYLYWDISVIDGTLSRGFTSRNPVYQSSAPSNPLVDQHWFDTSSTTMKVWNGGKWVTKIRVFAGVLTNNALTMQTVGSQAGIIGNFDTGYLLFDGDNIPIRKSTGEFFTTETWVYPNYSASPAAAKLEGQLIPVIAGEYIEKYSLVALTGPNTVGKCRITDITAGRITNITLKHGGSGYVSAPTVTLVGGDGYGATAKATIKDGIVTNITVSNAGQNYTTTAPTVVISGGGSNNSTPSDTAIATCVVSRLAVGMVNKKVAPGEQAYLVFRGQITNDVWNWDDKYAGQSVYCSDVGQVTVTRPNGAVVQKIGTIVNSKSIFLDIDSETIAALLAGISTVASLSLVAPLKNTGTDSNPVVSLPKATSVANGYMSAADINRIDALEQNLTNEVNNRKTAILGKVSKIGDEMMGTLTVTTQADALTASDLVLKQVSTTLTPKVSLIGTTGGTPSINWTVSKPTDSIGVSKLFANNSAYLQLDIFNDEKSPVTKLQYSRTGVFDVGGAVIRSVGTPILGTDAINKSVFDAHTTDETVHITVDQNTLLDGIVGRVSISEILMLQGASSNIQQQLNSKVNKAGDSLTGPLYYPVDPVSPTELVNKAYVDSLQTTLGYAYSQDLPADTWIINHNKNTLHFTFNVLEFDGQSYTAILPTNVIATENTVTLSFTSRRRGKATLVLYTGN